MDKKILFLVIGISLFAVAALLTLNLTTEKTQATEFDSMFEKIDAKAKNTQNGLRNSYEDLIDTIFVNYTVNELDSITVASLKDRLVRAESAGQVVDEANVVETVNWLANEFSAPKYAQTSSLQIRVSRVNLGKLMPNLFLNKDSSGNLAASRPVNSELSSSLSPSQSVCLLLTVLQQKVLNQDYQKEPSQWDSDFHNSQLVEDSANSSPQATEPTLMRKTNTQKSDEMIQLISNQTLSVGDMDTYTHLILDHLGIPR
jgi:hypothetical protein